MSYVRGKDITIAVEGVSGSGDFDFSACGTNFSTERTAEKINITTADSGKENEYEGGATDGTGSVEGLITLDELTKFQYEDWVAAIGTKKRVQIDYTDTYGDRLRYEMDILIDGVSDRGDVNDFGAFTVTFTRSGAEVVTKVWDHALVDSDGDPIPDSDGDIIRTN